MPNSIFISYRRDDSQHAAFAVADRLAWAFGAEEVFFDRGSIREGDGWQDLLERGLKTVKVLVVIVGKTWLTTADKWGRRRIDDEADWVRREILAGLAAHTERNVTIIPVLLEDVPRLHADAFDSVLRPIAGFEPLHLTADAWEETLKKLIAGVAEKSGVALLQRHGEQKANGSPARPHPAQQAQTPMSDAEVRKALEPLARWQLQWGPHPWGTGGLAQEIVKSYDFSSFVDAVTFMADAAKEIDAWKPPHHPRWENQWKVVNVLFTTWDVNCRVTKLDIAAAKKFDLLFARWTARSVGV